jgi:hypothetical protein
MFPDMSSIRIHEMISHFYARACERVDDTQAELVETLRKEYGREFGTGLTVSVAHEVQRLMPSDGSQAAFDAILQAARNGLNLGDREDPLNAHVPLAQYCDTHEEHQVVVLLTVTMLEKLFSELLTYLFIRSGKDCEKARKAMKATRGHASREKVFAGLTGVSLGDAISKSGVTHFYPYWHETRAVRNKFMHELPFVVGVSHAEKAFDLARDAFRVFARLRNQFL